MKVDAEDTEARVLKAAGTDQLIDWLMDLLMLKRENLIDW